MDQRDEEEIQELSLQIEGTRDDVSCVLPFDLFDKQSNRTTQLQATSGVKGPVDGKRRWYDYKFKVLTLITRVEVQVSGYSDYSDFDIDILDDSGKERRLEGTPRDGVLSFAVNDICKRVSFRPPSQWFSNTQIQEVRVMGVPRDAVPQMLDKLSDLEGYKQEIQSIAEKAVNRAEAKIAESQRAATERTAIQRENQQLKAQQSRLKKSVDDFSLKRAELLAQNTASEDAITAADQRLKRINGEVESLTSQNSKLQEEIVNCETYLKSLKSNINLFPTEIVDFVNQGSKNLKQYFHLALAPIGVLVIMFVLLVSGAADLSVIITNNPNININAVVLSRLPYVTIALAIITACYKIARAFIMEMIKINNQRLSLTKISIIAKDVSASAEKDLDLSDEDIYRLRTDLKMQLLRDHMKEYISKDFQIEMPKTIGFFLGAPKISRDKQETAAATAVTQGVT